MMLWWVALLVLELESTEPKVCVVSEAEPSPLIVRTRAELASAVGAPISVVPTDTASCANLVVVDEVEHHIVLRLSHGAPVIEEPYDPAAPLSVVASHIAEMLRAALLEVETREAARAATLAMVKADGGLAVSAAPELEPIAPAPLARGRVTLSPGAMLSVGGLAPAPVVLLDVTVRAWQRLWFGVTAFAPVGSLWVRVPEGMAWLRPVGGWVSVYASLLANERVQVQLGAGVGARWSHVEGRAVAPFESASGDRVSALFEAEARLDVRLFGPWGARVAASVQTDAPRVTVETAGVSAASFGRLVGVFSAGVNVSW